MAGKPQVTLTLAGDASALEKAFDSVGASSKKMADEVGSSSKKVATETVDAYDRAGEAADNVDTKAMGFRDTLTGVQDTMGGVAALSKGPSLEGFLLLGTGIGDLGSGFYNFLIPAFKAFSIEAIKSAVNTVRSTAAMVAQRSATLAVSAASKAYAAAQWLLNAALTANPIGLVIAAIALLVAGIVIAYKRSETFRSIVQAAMRGVVTAFKWVVDAGEKVWEFFKFIGPRIGGALKGVAAVITAPFRAAFAAVRGAWNNTIGGKGFSIPDWVPEIGGKSFRIPYFHSGGVVSGALGAESLAVVKAGERITGGSYGASGGALVITGEGDIAKTLLRIVARQAVVQGGAKVVFAL